MTTAADSLDKAAAHRHFSVSCFNAVWGLLDKADRSKAENEQLVALAHTSIWHWTQREDCTPRNLSIGYWQLSRVYATLGQGERAMHYGQLCLDVSQGDEPFYLGYAHETLARAASVLKDTKTAEEHLRQARALASVVSDEEERKLLLSDLDSVSRNSK